MAVLETLEGDNTDPEILCSTGWKGIAPKASAAAWEPTMADILNRKPRRPALISGIPAKMRAVAANKGTATRRPVRRIPARGAAGAKPWSSSSGRFTMVGEDIDPESLEGWLTDLKKGAGKVVSAVGSVGSAIVRPVASVGLNVLRSTAAPAGTLIGTAIGSAFGTTQMGAGTQGLLANVFGAGGTTDPGAGGVTYQNAPAASGGIPTIYLLGGGALLLVLLLRK